MLRTDVLEQLPVRACLPALSDALGTRGTAVLCAPPGTGKTTLVPLHLAGLTGEHPGGPQHVLVAEPRRMAARSAARRMAWMLGEEPGAAVGFAVRGERRAGPRTRVEVVTTGVLLQRLQRDQELPGVDVVLLDECHERHLDADTALAFLLDVRATLRPDLQVVAASATQDSDAWARLLATHDTAPHCGPAPVVHGSGGAHPVDVRHAPPPAAVRPAHGTWVDPALLRHVAATVRQALAQVPDGDVLCFLPGVGEIGRVAGLLDGCGAEVLQLHGRAPAPVQDAVLDGSRDGGRRRVVLTTSVAESSLTVPGVRVVVDSGLAREPRMDHARGLGSLATVSVSRAAAAQRQGRAGREAPGAVYRCWSPGEDAARPKWPSPEISVADLTAFALQTAAWGDPDAAGLALPDPPPAGAMAAAGDTLRAVGAVDARGRLTGRGALTARMGVHPRLARALLDGAPLVGERAAAEAVALLSEEPPREYGTDLTDALRAARRRTDAYGTRWSAEVRRLRSALRAAQAGPGPAKDRPVRAADTGGGPEDSAGNKSPGGAAPYGAQAERVPDSAESGAAGSSNHTTKGTPPADPADTEESRKGGSAARSVRHPAVAQGGRGPRAADPDGTNSPAARGDGGGQDRPDGTAPLPYDAAAGQGPADGDPVGLIAALAYPERVARARGRLNWLMVNGTGAEATEGSPLRDADWLAVAVADRPVNSPSARIRRAAVIGERTARAAAGTLHTTEAEVRWDAGRREVVAAETERLGAVELTSRPLAAPGPALLRAAVLEGLRAEGTGLLRWTRDAVSLRARLAFLHRELGEPWPDVSEEALLARAEEWLGEARRRADLERTDAGEVLRRLLPWAGGEAARLDELAPERLQVPSGSRVRVDYGPEQPVLAVKLQELFGWTRTPRVADGRVPLVVHLLSPAGRPAAITGDLAGFWRDGYRAVRAELRGRYPRHPWPEDPATAEPTRRANARRADRASGRSGLG